MAVIGCVGRGRIADLAHKPEEGVRVVAGADKYPDAIDSFKAACDSLDAKATIESANRLLDNRSATAEKLKNGEGTVGKLINDDELYNEINGLAKDVRQVLDNFRDTTPISTFGSLIMGGL